MRCERVSVYTCAQYADICLFMCVCIHLHSIFICACLCMCMCPCVPLNYACVFVCIYVYIYMRCTCAFNFPLFLQGCFHSFATLATLMQRERMWKHPCTKRELK